MRLTIVGTGYVGLVSGVCLAKRGHDVTCVDLRPEIVDSLNKSVPTIHENGLAALLAEVVREKRFRATTRLDEALASSEAVMIAVGTPSENGRIDLRFVRDAAESIGAHLKTRGSYLPVVVKSTVVPGTTDTFVRQAIEESSGKILGREFGLGMNPEFLREGDAIVDFMEADRVVMGFEDEKTLAALEKLYAPWDCPKIRVNTRTAEMIKYVNNGLLALQISASNELANLAAKLGGIDFMEVLAGVQSDKRWNPRVSANGMRANPGILTYQVPGCGFGGSCFPKDVQALRTLGQDQGLPMRVLQSVLDINEAQPDVAAQSILQALPSGKERVVLLLGLAFKPDTDDVRESTSLKIAKQLVTKGVHVLAHDPIAVSQARRVMPDLKIDYVDDWKSSVDSCDAIVLATSWPEYRGLLDTSLKARLKGKVIFDARRFFKRSDFSDSLYLTIGFRPGSTSTLDKGILS